MVFTNKKLAVTAGALLLLASYASADEITVGGVQIDIPPPPGFVVVTPEMTALYEFQKQLVPPMNAQLLVFIPEEVAPTALAGEIPTFEKWYIVQTPKNLMGTTVSSADFQHVKALIKSENEKVFKELGQKIPDLLGGITKGMTEKLGVDLRLSAAHAIPLPPHLETDRAIAYSSLWKYDIDGNTDESTRKIIAVTATTIHVKGKILYLYCYADESGLEWTREASKEWLTATVADNPSDLGTLVKEALPGPLLRIDWAYVFGAGVGAIAGAVVGVLAWLKRRSRARSKRTPTSPPEIQ